MATRKRSFAAGDVVVESHHTDVDWGSCDQRLGQRSQRRCGTASRPGPGALSSSEVAAFMARLNPELTQLDSQSLLSVTGLGVAAWQSFAELNSCLEQHWHLLSGSMLRSYHSWCAQDRLSLWINYAKAYSVSEAAAKAPSSQAYQPGHLQLVRFLLEYVVAQHCQASITEYKITLPPWMVGYAARWGWGSDTISLLVLQVYAPIDPGCSRTSSSRQPAYKIFVPMLS